MSQQFSDFLNETVRGLDEGLVRVGRTVGALEETLSGVQKATLLFGFIVVVIRLEGWQWVRRHEAADLTTLFQPIFDGRDGLDSNRIPATQGSVAANTRPVPNGKPMITASQIAQFSFAFRIDLSPYV